MLRICSREQCTTGGPTGAYVTLLRIGTAVTLGLFTRVTRAILSPTAFPALSRYLISLLFQGAVMPRDPVDVG